MAQENTANVDSSAANNATGKAHTIAAARPTSPSIRTVPESLVIAQTRVDELYPQQPAPKPSTHTSASASQPQPSQTVTDTSNSPPAWQVPTNNAVQPLPTVSLVNLPSSPQSQSQAPIAQPTVLPPEPTPSPPSKTSTSIATSTKIPFPVSHSFTLTNNNIPITAPARPITINHTLSLNPSTATDVKIGTVAAGFTLVVSGITLAVPPGATNVMIDGTTTAGLGGAALFGLGIAAPTGSGNGSTKSGNGSVVAFAGGASQLADGEGLSWWIGVVVLVGGMYLRLGL